MNLQSRSAVPFLCYSVLFVLIAVLVGYYHLMDREHALSLLHEDGPVEVVTALTYGFCLLVMLIIGGMPYIRQHGALVILVGLMGLRELDFDKRFTDTGMLQSRVLTSPDVALSERVAGLLVMAFLAALFVYTLRRYLMAFVLRLSRLDPIATGTVIAFGLAAFSKTIDGLGRKLTPMGIDVSDQAAFTAIVLEEVTELGIPLALTVATVIYLKGWERR